VSEPSFGIFWSNKLERPGGGLIEQFFASGFGCSQQLLDLGPAVFDRIQIGRIKRQIQQCRAYRLNSLPHARNLV
jgi:hypothetical protein